MPRARVDEHLLRRCLRATKAEGGEIVIEDARKGVTLRIVAGAVRKSLPSTDLDDDGGSGCDEVFGVTP